MIFVPTVNINSKSSKPSLVSIVNVSNSLNASFDLTNLVINSSLTLKDTLQSSESLMSGTLGITAGSARLNFILILLMILKIYLVT